MSTSSGPIALGSGVLNQATFTLLNGAVERRDNFLDSKVSTVIFGALGLFQASPNPVAILKGNEMALKEGERPLVLMPAAGAAAVLSARHAARAPLAAAAVVNPLENSAAIFFGRVSVGTTNAAHQRTLTITNDGAGTLTLGAVTVDGAAAGDFAATPPAVSTLGAPIRPPPDSTATSRAAPASSPARARAARRPSHSASAA